MRYLKYFRYYMKMYPFYFWSGVTFLFLTDLLDVIPPLIIMKGVDEITSSAPIEKLRETALLFAGLTLALAVVRYFWRMQFGKFHQNAARDLRERIFSKLTELGPGFYSKNTTGDLMSLISNDVETVRMGIGPGVLVLTDAVFYFLTIPFIMMRISVSLTLQTLCLLPFLPFFIHWMGKIIHERFLEVQDRFGNLAGITQENISGIRVVKSYVQEKNQIGIFNIISGGWRDANLKVAWTESFMHPVMEFCVTVSVVTLIYFGSQKAAAGALTVGAFVAIHRYISKMVWPMTAVGWGFNLVAQARASLDRIHEFLETTPEVQTPLLNSQQDKAQDLDGPLEVKNLNFRYPGSERLALKNISFKIEPGDTFGIVGPVGAGKTTLAQVLCHLFEIDRGMIFVNGHDIRDIPVAKLRRHISFVPQDTFLFSTTIGENMAFGLEITPALEALVRTAQVANLDTEIDTLPQRYDTYLGERGVNLSGGQKQRMAITRALLRSSPVIIFDDSLSAVDAHTESLILRRLKEETRKHTTIIISHRLSTLALCNKMIILKEGIMEAVGTPQELRQNSVIYQELLELQGYL